MRRVVEGLRAVAFIEVVVVVDEDGLAPEDVQRPVGVGHRRPLGRDGRRRPRVVLQVGRFRWRRRREGRRLGHDVGPRRRLAVGLDINLRRLGGLAVVLLVGHASFEHFARAERRHLRRFGRDLIRKIPRVGLLGKINPTVDDERARAVIRDGDAIRRHASPARERLNKRRLGRVVEGTDGSAREDQRRLRGAAIGEGPGRL
mmetsp:Transcript_20958/g.54619  ORF Transcript_20958/g.54619 Transcript_20958/m.54619 type:complete len:202 (+) Transcript_20958:765-1370(+)